MCGLFGFINYSGDKIKDLSKLTNYLARESTVRGTDATGIAYVNSGGIHIEKDNKSAFRIDFKHSDDIKGLIGHTRHSTQGSEKKNFNNHPFKGYCQNSRFAFAHNGVLSNDIDLRKKHKLPRTKIETDSYISVQLIESKKFLGFDSIKYMAEQVSGSFSFSIVDDKNNVWLVKGDSPLSILHFPKLKLYVFASTDEILYKAIVDYPQLFSALKNSEYDKIHISEGEILKIRPDGVIDKGYFDYVTYYGYKWWYYGSSAASNIKSNEGKYTRDDYIEDLKSVSGYLGYSPEDIDMLIAEGYDLEEIEEYIYCCAGGEI